MALNITNTNAFQKVKIIWMKLLQSLISNRISANGSFAVQIVKKLGVETSHFTPVDFTLHSNDTWGLSRVTEDRVVLARKPKPVFTSA